MTYEPYQCLTVRLGELEANVHSVNGGQVYYGVYRDGVAVAMYRKAIAAFMEGVDIAIEQGGTVFSMIAQPFGDKS